MSDLAQLVLRTVFETRAHTRALKDGRLKIPGVSFDFVEFPRINMAMEGMADRLEFDVGEVTLVDYLLALRFGRPLAGLPIFVNRNFSHSRVMYNVRSGIRGPKDLEGRRVGVKSYSQTAPVWNRGILAADYGVDLDRVTWVVVQGSHLSQYRDPSNVVRVEGRVLAEMLESGEVDAADDPGRPWSDRGETWEFDKDLIKPLIPNHQEAAADWYKRTGAYPILHLLVVKRSVVDARPSIMRELFEAFATMKRDYMGTLKGNPGLRVSGYSIVGQDFLPYGVGKNSATLDLLCEFAYRQNITTKRYRIEDLFEPEVIGFRE